MHVADDDGLSTLEACRLLRASCRLFILQEIHAVEAAYSSCLTNTTFLLPVILLIETAHIIK